MTNCQVTTGGLSGPHCPVQPPTPIGQWVLVLPGFDGSAPFHLAFDGLYKAEVIHRRGPWRSFEAVEFATLEWGDWFNHRRLLEPIGNIPPAEAEASYYAATAAMDNLPMAA